MAHYKVAHNNRRLVTLMHGELLGDLYGANEDLLSVFGDSYRKSFAFLGIPWASRVAGVDLADPTLVMSYVAGGGRPTMGLLLGLCIPLVLALFFGKVFCSHLCPMRLMFELGQRVRRGMGFLGLRLPAYRSKARFGGWVLLGGIVASVLAGHAVWLWILPYVSLSASIFIGIAFGVSSSLVLSRQGSFATTCAPRGSCLKLCRDLLFFVCASAHPTIVSEELRRVSGHVPLCAISKRIDSSSCVRQLWCVRCSMSISEARTRFGAPLAALPFFLALAASTPRSAAAHHNKGMPHYGYFENSSGSHRRIRGDSRTLGDRRDSF